jgi:hypothetical protein
MIFRSASRIDIITAVALAFATGIATAAPPDRAQLERELRAAQAIEKQSPGKAEALLVDEALAALAALDVSVVPEVAAQGGAILEHEPNNTVATATSILSGTVPFPAGFGTITAGDSDYWSFTAPGGSRVWIGTDTGGQQGAGATSRDTVIDLFASDGTTVFENDDDDGTANGGDGTVEAEVASVIAGRPISNTGTYYVRVKGYNNTSVIIPYRLSIVVTTTASVAETEPNNTAATADVIAFGPSVGIRGGSIGAAGDADYYSMAAGGGSTVYFVADADPTRSGNGTDLVLEFRDSSDQLLLSVDSSIEGSLANPAGEGARYVVPVVGAYYVKVRHYSSSGTGTYRLMVSISDDTIFESGFD